MHCTEHQNVVARTSHRCTWCGEEIEPGSAYLRWSSVDDGKWSASKMHPECLEACREADRENGTNEYDPYDNERPPKTADMIPAAR